MSGEELALETQLLLQEAAQVTQQAAVESVLDDAGAPPPANEFEAAKSALLAKLRRKKEANRAQQQRLNQRRYGPVAPPTAKKSPKKAEEQLFSPRKARALNLPVAATTAASASGRKKQDMLARLRTQAIQQGAQNMAKLFGYASFEEQLKHLNKIEKMKILQDEMKDKQEKEKEQQQGEEEDADEEEKEEEGDHSMEVDADADAADAPEQEESKAEPEVEGASAEGEQVEASSEAAAGKVSPRKASPKKSVENAAEQDEQESVKVVRRRNRIQKQDAEEEDGNEVDSEQDDKDGDDADEDMEDASAAVEVTNDAQEPGNDAEKDGESSESAKPTKPKDKAAGYRRLLQAEAMQNRKRKRLIKGRGADNLVESEAEEDEEEDVLKIGGLGDFGFGVPQAKTQESKEAEEERNALKLREDDLDHIVDDLSDDERAQEQDLDEMFRREQEDQDRQQVKEVMRNVKEGFGRNRRAFSGLHSGSEARGRFNLDELVAADGSKFEAARLGLLESDEELSEGEDGKKKKKVNADGEEEEEEEEEDEDEEAEMERVLRERFTNQPKIYVTSSESGSDDEEENEAKKDNGPDGDEVESDEERERQQMKLFSERARINRRMQRMKDLQRQIALENNEADPTAKSSAAMPNLLLEEDEDSQELMHLMKRTDVDATAANSQTAAEKTQKKSRTDRPRPKLGRFNSYGGMTSASRSSSSFSRVVGHCKLFSASSSGGAASSKGFVFTSFSSDKAEDGGNENAAPNNDEAMPAARPELGKSKSWGGSKAATKRPGAGKAAASNKKRKTGGLFSVLSSYQCVSSTSQSQE